MLIIYNLYGVKVILDLTFKYYRLLDGQNEISFHCFKEVNETLFIQINEEVKQYNRSMISTDGTTGRI